ncbi:GTP cyclohydrolase N terminal-domain-containing protein [Ochromonadaceae sp. CCMP2298]|nr:GTP cyclohydrolase N terminal-domain-containing protein [Ochromonadaceae sp. CCMP2298]
MSGRKRSHSVSEKDIEEPERNTMDYISLTTHDGEFGSNPIGMKWGAATPAERGPVIATVKHGGQRNAIGAHSGGYCIYTALAVAAGELNTNHIPDLKMTTPTNDFGPFGSWKDAKKIVTIDPWGHLVYSAFRPYFNKGYDIRPTIAVTKAHIDFPEVKDALRVGRITPDGKILKADGQSMVTKAAIEPVWFLPGVAERFGCTEQALRQALFKETNMMYPELLTRTDIKLFLPPIGGLTIYIWGDPDTIPDEKVELTVRVHDECNGSDVFGSDICTCRPYLAHAIEECIRTAQRG